MSDIGLFEAIDSMRAMRRLDTRPVPLSMIRRVLDAGTRAPSGQNSQPWAFLVVQDEEGKRFVQQRYHGAMRLRFGEFYDAIPVEDRLPEGELRTRPPRAGRGNHTLRTLGRALGVR